MTERKEIKYRMKRLARKFCRRNNVYFCFDGSVAELIEKAYLSAYLLCLHENKHKRTELEKENEKLKKEIEISQRCWQEQKNISLDTNCKLHKAKELLKQWLQTSKAGGCDNINIVADTEQFLKEE